MSRSYRADVIVEKCNKAQEEALDAAITEFCGGDADFSVDFSYKDTYHKGFHVQLGGGKLEECYAEELALALQQTVKTKITIRMTYLDDMPYEDYTFPMK